MTTITFDTLKYAKQLEASGIPAAQAEAFVNAQREILGEVLDTTLATRSDLLKLESKMDKEFSAIKTDLAVLKWGTGLVIAGIAAQLVKLFVA